MFGHGAINYANARYANTQTKANANDCNTGTNCTINSPQTQGDGGASSPTNLQISEANGDVSIQPPNVRRGDCTPPNSNTCKL